jgi:Met-zincin
MIRPEHNMISSMFRQVLGSAAVCALMVAAGCAVDRPARTGVFDENQYLRKDFLISRVDANGDAVESDPGWLMRTTVTETSTPNVLGAAISVWGGLQAEVDLVRFRITQDKLQLLSMRQLSTLDGKDQSASSVTDSIDNAWPVTNVDLKYRVNLDGERTNFYEENQEQPWEQRQWLKLNFAKNDFSDLAPLGPFTTDLLDHCADLGSASATLVTDSFHSDDAGDTDPSNDYMEFTVQVAVPMKFDDTACIEAYGAMLDNAGRLNRFNVTVNLKYSFRRAEPTKALTYKKFPLDEKDPIHHKYGPFLYTSFNRDTDTGLVAANQYVGRFDPEKPIVWYFDQGFPERYKPFFNDMRDQTNALLERSGAKARVSFKERNDGIAISTKYTDEISCDGAHLYWDEGKCYEQPTRKYGDIRYNFFRWASDEDLQDGFAGVTMPGFDPRTGEIVNESIEFNDFAIKDFYVERIDAFLRSIGASQNIDSTDPTTLKPVEWQCPESGCACNAGDTLAIAPATLISEHNQHSTLFTKMQQYLGVHSTDPDPGNDHLGPQDFIAPQDDDFFHTYFSLIPYQLFADPDMNLFVTREGGNGVYGPASVWQHLQDEAEFHALTAKMNNGETPYEDASGPEGLHNAAAFANRMRDLTRSHVEYDRMKTFIHGALHRDAPDAFSLESVIIKDARRCVDGQWESKESWTAGLIDSYWQQVIWHEFGHAMGLEHNFMASVDKPNFPDPVVDANGAPHYSLYASSVMEYNAAPDRVFWTPGWGKYDQGAISWIYANNGKKTPDAGETAKATDALSGQVDASYPYNDPYGFDDSGAEREFLRCDENHLKYSPLCRQGDLGTTPSEIIANAIDMYEWQYPWRNFRNYRKTWNNAAYGDGVVTTINDLKRFLSMWAFDWSAGEITTILHRIGVNPPPDAVSVQNYYQQLTQKFLVEMSTANRVVASFHKALIQQASGERPYATVYDKFFGDELQQGIILDKYFAMQAWVGLWPSDNYDQNEAGALLSSWGDFGERSYQSIAEDVVTSMVGSQYAAYPYFIPTAVALFAQDTHNPAFIGSGRTEAKDWIGGQVFDREQDLIDYFRGIAVDANGPLDAPCTAFDTCKYNVTDATQTQADKWNVFEGPDQLNYIYAYIASRNVWVVARQDRNIAAYKIIHDFNDDVLNRKDDGSDGAYSLELPMKYTLDSFKEYD